MRTLLCLFSGPSSLLLSVLLLSCADHRGPEVSLDGQWLFRLDPESRGVIDQWYHPDSSGNEWKNVTVPSAHGQPDFEGYDGVGWFRREFQIHDTSALSLVFRSVDDDAMVWLNGIEVGEQGGSEVPFWIETKGILREGMNSLVVRIADRGGRGGIIGSVSLVESSRVLEVLRSPFALENARQSATWVRNAVIYEVYLRSFSPEGTFEGLRKRIPELKQMGVTVLWLMPIHPVGELNRKGTLGSPYSVADYYGINEEFGTEEDFRNLVRDVHQNDMKIIIGMVANHTSWDSKLILEHPDWFTTDSEGAIVAPNPDWYDVADLNYNHHELRKYMLAVMEYWVREFDINGYRCDVSELVPLDFWERARIQLEKIKPVLLLSEGSMPEHHLSAFDITYAWNTYDVLGGLLDGSVRPSTIHRLIELEALEFPRGSLRLRFNSNHDKNAWDSPAIRKFGQDGAQLTAALTYCLPGVPLIYNGEEAGNNAKLDLFEQVPIDWNGGTDLRHFYTALAKLRRENPALVAGSYHPLDNSAGEHVLSFTRSLGADTLVALFNFSPSDQNVVPGLHMPLSGQLRDLLSGEEFTFTPEMRTISMGGHMFRICSWNPSHQEANP